MQRGLQLHSHDAVASHAVKIGFQLDRIGQNVREVWFLALIFPFSVVTAFPWEKKQSS